MRERNAIDNSIMRGAEIKKRFLHRQAKNCRNKKSKMNKVSSSSIINTPILAQYWDNNRLPNIGPILEKQCIANIGQKLAPQYWPKIEKTIYSQYWAKIVYQYWPNIGII